MIFVLKKPLGGFLARVFNRERAMRDPVLRGLVGVHTVRRQLGILGEPRINVLQLNRALDAYFPLH